MMPGCVLIFFSKFEDKAGDRLHPPHSLSRHSRQTIATAIHLAKLAARKWETPPPLTTLLLPPFLLNADHKSINILQHPKYINYHIHQSLRSSPKRNFAFPLNRGAMGHCELGNVRSSEVVWVEFDMPPSLPNASMLYTANCLSFSLRGDRLKKGTWHLPGGDEE